MRRYCGFLVFLYTLSAFAQGRIDCDGLKSRILSQTVHYCVLLPPSYDSASSTQYPVLYYLHGLGQDEQALFKAGGWNVIEDLRQKHAITDFLVVTPEAKASFYVNSADGKLRYNDFFLREFMPYIESHYRIRRERGARGISGISMGGYGAFHFAFAHPELFTAVSAESAALMSESLHELNTAIHSGTPLGRLLGSVFGDPIDEAQWRQNDPFILAKENKLAIRHLAIYFNCGRDDEFDFEVGAAALHRQLDAEGIKHEFHLYPGDHSGSYFLSHLSEVIEFHSNQFRTRK